MSLTFWLADEEVFARCETVLNTTMAEMETHHTQKGEGFRQLTWYSFLAHILRPGAVVDNSRLQGPESAEKRSTGV